MKNFKLLFMMAMIAVLSVVLVACADDSDVEPEADTEEGTATETEEGTDQVKGPVAEIWSYLKLQIL